MMKLFAIGVPALAALASVAFVSLQTLFAQANHAEEYRISGPYTHENLSVFLFHGSSRSTKDMLTLEEAIAQHKVVVYETRNVNELAIENVSDEDVFIESGDIAKGGAQDRTLKDDLILPTKSGRVNISSFCVEHGRWSARGKEPVSTFDSATEALATKELKMAVKMKADQREVWSQVAAAQASISNALRSDVRAAAAPTSFAMTMQTPAVQKSIDSYLEALRGVAGNSDVIGYAFAINGKVNSADVYVSHSLFARLWPKLLRASAVEAVSEYQSGIKFEPATTAAVKAAVADADSGKGSLREVTSRTGVLVKETPRNILFETRDRAHGDAWIHRNYMTK
jgi:ARG and Rhodanese-Phosphatase-superfamily-associated Protein domain